MYSVVERGRKDSLGQLCFAPNTVRPAGRTAIQGRRPVQVCADLSSFVCQTNHYCLIAHPLNIVNSHAHLVVITTYNVSTRTCIYHAYSYWPTSAPVTMKACIYITNNITSTVQVCKQQQQIASGSLSLITGLYMY